MSLGFLMASSPVHVTSGRASTRGPDLKRSFSTEISSLGRREIVRPDPSDVAEMVARLSMASRDAYLKDSVCIFNVYLTYIWCKPC
jgi:hypothetical protein